MGCPLGWATPFAFGDHEDAPLDGAVAPFTSALGPAGAGGRVSLGGGEVLWECQSGGAWYGVVGAAGGVLPPAPCCGHAGPLLGAP